MSFDPALSTTRDMLRFLLSDFINSAMRRDFEHVPDETYDALILRFGGRGAGARIADTISNDYGVKWQQGDQSEDTVQLMNRYAALADRFRGDPSFIVDPDEDPIGFISVQTLVTPDMVGYL